jgi:SAM-dependent methyltransferase
MENAELLKEQVREKYGAIAREGGSCCGPTSCCGPSDGESLFVNISDDYKGTEGYVEEADLGLGCGIPTEAADLKPGQVVLDLGSGAGNDVFVARKIVGDTGRVIGVDMTPDMIKKARENAARQGYANVEFRLGEIEALPVTNSSVDRIISNCVLNLIPNKQGAFSEMLRVLRPGGSFGVSDVVLEGELPQGLKEAAELYVGCVSGAIQKADYLEMLRSAGFENVRVVKEKGIELPDDLVAAYLPEDPRGALKASGVRVLSVTVQGSKPSAAASCCTPLAQAGACCSPAA